MMSDLLSQDEIDALLHGVDSGAIETEEPPVDPGVARPYDFSTQDRIIRGRLPTLEMINERFVRTWRIGLFNLLRRSSELSVRGIEMIKFGEYIHSLYVPTNLNLIKFKPLRGVGLIVFELRLSTPWSTTSSAATAATRPASRAASSPRPRCASSSCCSSRPSPIWSRPGRR